VIRRLAWWCLAAGLLASCTGAGRPTLSDDTLPEPRCSADGMPIGPLDSDGLPSPVAARRQELVDAAVACDYRALGRLAFENSVDLRYEGEPMPVAQWREREHDGQPILRPLAGLLSLAHTRDEEDGARRFTWPTAVDWPSADVAPSPERSALRELVGEAGIFGWAEAGGYGGWRTSITANGDWTRFWYGPVDGEYEDP
jgi:hypothetical protein